MNYFVSIESTSYDLWQTELLIQSFKKLGMQDSLYIAIADKGVDVNPDFTSNITEHKNKFVFQDLGGIKNRFYALKHLLYEGIIKLPLATIHPDMLLINPIGTFDVDLIFSIFDTDQEYKKDIKSIINNMCPDKAWLILNPSAVFCVGPFMPYSFFDTLFNYSMQFPDDQRSVEKIIWHLAAIELYKEDKLDIQHVQFEQCLRSYALTTNFIHYNHGYPPIFHKKYFKYNDITIDSSHPYKAMCLVDTNESTRHMIEIVNSYLKEWNFTLDYS